MKDIYLMPGEKASKRDINKKAAKGIRKGKVYELYPIYHNQFETRQELTSATDYQVFDRIKYGTPEVSKLALEVMFKRYELAIRKQGHILNDKIKSFNMKGMNLNTDDYLTESFVSFKNAVDSVWLERIEPKKKKTWKFWQCLTMYLMSYNRDRINANYKKSLHEKQNGGFTQTDIEDATYRNLPEEDYESAPDAQFQKKEERAIFWNAVDNAKKRLSKRQVKILDFKYSENPRRKEICEKFKLSEKDYYNELKTIKTVLGEELSSAKRSLGVEEFETLM